MNFKKLILYSSNIIQQKAFYTNVLGFELLEEQTNSCTLKIGKTALQFIDKKDATPYHFALNIPSNQGAAALAWLKERVAILDFEGQELVDFTDWNAEAMYFYDMDGNIVEFIARKNLQDNSNLPFSINNILEISEIGIPTNDVQGLYHQIQTTFPIEKYSGDLSRFAALGDERGLFIVINKNIKKWIPRDDEPHSSPFEVQLEFKGKPFSLSF